MAAAQIKTYADAHPSASILVFDASSSEPVELDLRGSGAEVLARLPVAAPPSPRAPGRPKLGVVPREVTLLPRHWEWLAAQPGGASVALRKLVEQASRANSEADRQRQNQETAYRFMNAIAGNQPNFEEACRALFASDLTRLQTLLSAWPTDLAAHTLALAAGTTNLDAE
jgi:hypothetical protein